MKQPPDSKVVGQRGIEFGWRVHGALDAWTGKVDTKASIALALESAVFGFVVTLTERGKQFADLHGASQRWYYVGAALVLAAVLLSGLVVLPQLNRRKARREWKSGMIYFGHLRHWDPKELATALEREELYEEQLARQLVAMSKIAWRSTPGCSGPLSAW
jgi:hypothetical protein